MNKNVRGSYDAARAHRNNINIQINFNVKDKNQGFTGKKIDNYVEIEQKNTLKGEGQGRQLEEQKKGKKKQGQAAQRQQKQKAFDTPNKHKNTSVTKMTKGNSEKTPEKKEGSRKEERSKSASQKLRKRKNAKSIQNIRAGFRYTKNKNNSPQSSGQKSRQHSKSSKKVIKSSQQSLKNLHVFSNSKIKTKINQNQSASKSVKNREKQSSLIGKKGSKQQDHEKIKRFMEDKKKKQKLQKSRSMREDKVKRERIQSELKKVEIERKINASKPIVIDKKFFQEKRQRLPIYGLDEDFDESDEYSKLQKEASDLIHATPPRSNPMQGVPVRMQKVENSSSKKSSKKKRGELVYRYLNGTITSKQLQDLTKSVRTIQRCWRGYLIRRSFAKKLNDQSVRIRYMRNRIENKRGNFWDGEEENSIVNLEKDVSVKINQSGSSSNYLNFNSHQRSEEQNSQMISDEKNKTDRFRRLQIQLQDEGEDSKERSEKETYDNSKMIKEIEELRKMLEQQNKKYQSLEEENQNLKANIKVLSLKQSRNKGDKAEDLINSNEFIEIRMPRKIESPHNQIQIQQSETLHEFQKEKQLPLNKNIEKHVEEEFHQFDMSEYKKQFQAFECSSPSNARLEQQLKKLRGKNIENIFLKKELKVQQNYQKKSAIFDKMLNDRLFSPRTYNMKKKELQQKLKNEKSQIKQKIEEAKTVIGYIEDVSDDSQREPEGKKMEKGSINRPQISQIEPNFKKDKVKIDVFTNTSPLQSVEKGFKASKLQDKHVGISDSNSHSSYSSEDDRIYKKYWTDDIQQVHKHTLQITKKIEEALKAESQESSNQNLHEDLQKQFSSSEGEHHQDYLIANRVKDPLKQSVQEKKQKQEGQHGYSKSFGSEPEVDIHALKDAYNQYLQEIKQMPHDAQQKARQIFNKIDLSEQFQSKSDEQLQNSHDNIFKLLNERPLSAPHHDQKKQTHNLYISEAQFNKQKHRQEQLSRSSSFQKSNRSFSANNHSQVQHKGFITNLTFIKEFCISICEYIRNNEQYKEEFIDNISKAIKFDYGELLRAYRVTVGGQMKNTYNTFQDEYIYPYFKIIASKVHTISHELFADFMKVYEEEKELGNNSSGAQSLNAKSKQMRQYFLISIIDNFNESLEFQKPGSVYGEPLPWLNNSKFLKNHQISYLKNLKDKTRDYSQQSEEEQTEEEKQLDQIFGSSIAKVIQWGSCLCGFIADPMPMEMGDSQIANLSDEQLNSIRQNRVGLMLQKWLIESQEQMTNSTAEYTQVLLCLTEKIADMLLLECSDEVSQLMDN